MKKKIIFTSITAIVVFLFWIIEDVKREVESALSKYGIEFSGCSFIYPYLKFETVQYDDFYAYNAKLDLRKIISVDALSKMAAIFDVSSSFVKLVIFSLADDSSSLALSIVNSSIFSSLALVIHVVYGTPKFPKVLMAK